MLHSPFRFLAAAAFGWFVNVLWFFNQCSFGICRGML